LARSLRLLREKSLKPSCGEDYNPVDAHHCRILLLSDGAVLTAPRLRSH